MAEKTLYWGDGTSDTITVSYSGAVGDSEAIVVPNSPNLTSSERSKTILFKTLDGKFSAPLTVTQKVTVQPSTSVKINNMYVVDGDDKPFNSAAYIQFSDALGVSKYKIVKQVQGPWKPVAFTYLSGVDRGAQPKILDGCRIYVWGLSSGDGSGVNTHEGYVLFYSGALFAALLSDNHLRLSSFEDSISATATLVLSNDAPCDPFIGNSLGIDSSIWEEGEGTYMDLKGQSGFFSGYAEGGYIPNQTIFWANRQVFFQVVSTIAQFYMCPPNTWYCNPHNQCTYVSDGQGVCKWPEFQ